MSHNYSKHFNKNNNDRRNGFKQDGSHDHVIDVNELPSHNHGNVAPEETVLEETANVVHYNDGFVSGCEKLRVREKDSAESGILTVLEKGTELKVDLTEDSSDKEFYKVITPSGVEGYCMKKFITIR